MKNSNNLDFFRFDNKFINIVNIPRIIFLDKRVSYNALGIYCQLVSLQEGSAPSAFFNDLTLFKNTDINTINEGLNELLELGYIREVSGEEFNCTKPMYKIFIEPNKKI